MAVIKKDLKKYYLVCDKEEEQDSGFYQSIIIAAEAESEKQYDDIIDTDASSPYACINISLKSITSWHPDSKTVCAGLFLGNAYIKWDGCTHWHFYGEESKGEKEKADSYYHLCGSYDFMIFIYGMIAAIKIGKQIVNTLPQEDFNYGDYIELEELFDKHCYVKEVTKEKFDKIVKVKE